MYIMGIHPGHDATAVILDGDGKVLAAIAEERLSRIKYHMAFPYKAVDECLRVAGLSCRDISAVAFGFRSFFTADTEDFTRAILDPDGGDVDLLGHRNVRGRWEMLRQTTAKNIGLLLGKSRDTSEFTDHTGQVLRDVLRDLGFSIDAVHLYNHHLAHGSSAYYTGAQPDPLIVTIDGSGDGLCASVCTVEKGKMKWIAGAPSRTSPGIFYSEITRHLGFRRNRHEGKVTGLAAYGDPDKCYPLLDRCLFLSDDEREFHNDLAEKSALLRKTNTFLRILKNQQLSNPYVNLLLDHYEQNLEPFTREEIAAAAQKKLEEVVVRYIQKFAQETGKRDMVLAGGIFANVRLNQKVAELPEVDSVFIHPNMGDGGVALGAAYLCLQENLPEGTVEPRRLGNVAFGPDYDSKAIKAALDKTGMEGKFVNDIDAHIAELIAAKKIVGFFNGRMEYGPRALGNRSILADPTDRSINNWLNKRLRRTEFMPFAPSCLASEAGTIFEGYSANSYPAEFMTITFDVNPDWRDRIKAVTHVDGTARPQVVTPEQNPRYHRVLEEYYKLTGLPLFVNTSFNIHEEPIVCTPEDAIRSFQEDCVDVLVMGNFVVENRSA